MSTVILTLGPFVIAHETTLIRRKDEMIKITEQDQVSKFKAQTFYKTEIIIIRYSFNLLQPEMSFYIRKIMMHLFGGISFEKGIYILTFHVLHIYVTYDAQKYLINKSSNFLTDRT
jgi:hypothetical protein